eukprot:COSAG02_NODE_15180_length_1196_cov_1.423883_1_plen_233_part_00
MPSLSNLGRACAPTPVPRRSFTDSLTPQLRAARGAGARPAAVGRHRFLRARTSSMLAGCCSRQQSQRGEPSTSAADTGANAASFALLGEQTISSDPCDLRVEDIALRQELAQLHQPPSALQQSQDELQRVLLRSLEDKAKHAADAAARRSAEADALLETEWHAAIGTSFDQAEVDAQLRGSAGAAVDEQQSWDPESQPDEPESESEPEPEPEPEASERPIVEGEPPLPGRRL